MKVLSLLQPWATLVVIGAKKIETRPWHVKDPKIRELIGSEGLLIHASQKITQFEKDLCKTEPFKTALEGIDELPLGKIIGKVDFLEDFKTDVADAFFYESDYFYGAVTEKKDWEKGWDLRVKKEKAFGDYSPGRWGWVFDNPVSFSTHTPMKGNLSVWDCDIRICAGCGCNEYDCRRCIEKTGGPCHWAGDNICSACVSEVVKTIKA